MPRYFLTLLILIALLIAACTNDLKYHWLGPQHTSLLSRAGVNEQKIAADYQITLIVQRGQSLEFEKSANTIVTLIKSISTGAAPEIDPSAKYIYGKIKLKKEYGQRIYTCDVRIEEGLIKGAIVHLRDGMLPESINESYQCFYRIPEDLDISEGPLQFKVIGWSAK